MRGAWRKRLLPRTDCARNNCPHNITTITVCALVVLSMFFVDISIIDISSASMGQRITNNLKTLYFSFAGFQTGFMKLTLISILTKKIV